MDTLCLSKDWKQYEDKIYYNPEDDCYYVKGDQQKVPFVGIRLNTVGAGDGVELICDTLIPLDLRNAFICNLANPANKRYVRFYSEAEAKELMNLAIASGIPEANKRLYTFAWSNTPPENSTVKEMWDKIWDIIQRRRSSRDLMRPKMSLVDLD